MKPKRLVSENVQDTPITTFILKKGNNNIALFLFKDIFILKRRDIEKWQRQREKDREIYLQSSVSLPK